MNSDRHSSAARREANRSHGRARGHRRVWARPIIPGRTTMVTIKTHQGHLFFQPGEDHEEINNFIGYALGRALELSGAEFHGAVMMGNHPHTLITDPKGELPMFKQVFHLLLARGMNARRGRFDKFWSPRGSCDTSRQQHDDTLADLVYILTNPVNSELVKWGGLWPGFTTYGWKFGETRTFRKPDWFFDRGNSDLPAEITVTLKRPPVFTDDLSDSALYDLLMEKIRVREKTIQNRVREAGRRFMGVQKLLRQRWNRPPRAPQVRFSQQRRVAGTSRWEILAGLCRSREWERDYASSKEEYVDGNREVVFPRGTYLLARQLGVNVATGPP